MSDMELQRRQIKTQLLRLYLHALLGQSEAIRADADQRWSRAIQTLKFYAGGGPSPAELAQRLYMALGNPQDVVAIVLSLWLRCVPVNEWQAFSKEFEASING
jgi:hypothetical protein